jgi:hypothetical protein
VLRSGDAVCGSDATIRIAEQREGELLIGRERPILLDRVERGTEDDRTEGLELVGPVTQRLAFDRSTGRRRLRIPPQQHPSTSQIRQPDRVAVLVGQLEVGCGIADVDHDPSVDERPVRSAITFGGGGGRGASGCRTVAVQRESDGVSSCPIPARRAGAHPP